MCTETSLDLRHFYPADLEIADICQTDHEIQIKIIAHSKDCICPKCGAISTHRHGTYERKVQDLPVLGKTTWLLINAYEYQCENPDCEVTTFSETVNGFLSHYSRMTERCADFICALAMETSCEGCSRICKAMNLKVSGDTVIRLLTKRYTLQEAAKCGSVIGVDDFAFKKRRNELQTVIGNDSIMTNCLPVINIFKMKSSRGYTNDYYEYHIVPNNVAANDYEVYNIESINFYDNINNLLLTAKPFYYTDVEVQFNNNYDYFAIHRRPRSDGLYTNRSSYKGYEVFASISGEKWQEVRDEIVQYSADLICTNRDLPLYIKANTKVSFAASQIESGVFINAPTKPLNPLINSGRREDWEKINHIMLNLSNILWKPGEVPVKIIKNIIKSYSLLSKDDTERILTSIVSIESEPATFRYINGNNGIFYEQGWKINMVISESKINDIGFFTFACVLWQFFQSYIPINSHIEFNVYSESYGLLKQWIM